MSDDAAGPDGGSPPRVSVIIATFNWSAALRCALASVLAQTFRDFEVLVVGDACSDDSEAVAASFGDPRIRWSNLPRNAGSQDGPNNAGLAAARGEWIAYLGHDDIWAPRHLETTLAAAEAAGTDAAVGGMIMYGPPGSGSTHTAGIFPGGLCAEADFVPPSALIHRRALIDRTGPWVDARTIALPTDCDFFRRVRAAGPVAATGEITVFKFNAAARRNAYQVRAVTEQERCLAGLARGDRYVAEELVKVVASASAGRWGPILMPDAGAFKPGELFRGNRVRKGVEHRFTPTELRSLTAPKRFALGGEPAGDEWHGLRRVGLFGSLRWTGAADSSTIELPVRIDRRLAVRIHILEAMVEDGLEQIVLRAQGVPIETTLERTKRGTWMLSGVIDPAGQASPVPYVQIVLTGVIAAQPPPAVGRGDARRRGIAVNWVELAPA